MCCMNKKLNFIKKKQPTNIIWSQIKESVQHKKNNHRLNTMIFKQTNFDLTITLTFPFNE